MVNPGQILDTNDVPRLKLIKDIPTYNTASNQEEAIDVKSLSLNDYKNWMDNMLADKGLSKKTNIAGEWETNFAEYGAALDDWLQEMVINGGSGEDESEGIDDDEQAIYNKLAGIYQNTNVVQTYDFISYARQMGFEVKSEYLETDYMVDYKASKSKSVKENGHICVLTITDPNTGADIVIADANGNAAIEVEELFLNEILTGLSSQIDPSSFGSYTANDRQSTDYYVDKFTPVAGETLVFSANSEKWLENEKEEIKEKAEKDEIKEEKEEDNENTIVTTREYNQLEEAFIEEYLEELKDDVKYKELSEEELEEMAQKEAQSYMKENYIVK